ncbi:hypothetical protein Tco_0812662 [Tanacetum coccineum]
MRLVFVNKQLILVIDVVDEDDDIIDEEDFIPHDLAYSDDEDLVNFDIDDGVNVMSADVARGHGDDGGGDDRSPPYQIPTGCGGCLGNRGKNFSIIGTRKPNLGGRRAARLHTHQETQNLGLKDITDKNGPVLIQFEFGDRETLMPLGEHAAHLANYLGELVRELSLHYPSWRQMPPKRKAEVVAKIGMESSATREYPSLIHTFFLTHTIGGVFLNPEDKALYDEMLRLQGLGSNTSICVPYTEDKIMAIVHGGKQRGHIPGVVRVLPRQGTVIPSDDKFSQMLTQLESQLEYGGGSGSGGCGDDEPGDDEDGGEDDEDEEDADSSTQKKCRPIPGDMSPGKVFTKIICRLFRETCRPGQGVIFVVGGWLLLAEDGEGYGRGQCRVTTGTRGGEGDERKKKRKEEEGIRDRERKKERRTRERKREERIREVGGEGRAKVETGITFMLGMESIVLKRGREIKGRKGRKKRCGKEDDGLEDYRGDERVAGAGRMSQEEHDEDGGEAVEG